MFGAIIGAVAGLAGASMDRSQRNKELAMQDPSYIRRTYEAAGFNPLLGIGNAPQLGYAPTMGHTLSNSIAASMDYFSEAKALELQKAQLEMENERLEKMAQKATLRPDVPGVYGNARYNTSPNNQPSSQGGSNSTSDPVYGDGGEPLAGPAPRDASLRVGGGWWKTNPWYSDAEDGETRYSDLLANVHGGINLIADGVYTGLYWGNEGWKAYSKAAKKHGKSFDEKAIRTYNSLKGYKPPFVGSPGTFGYMMNPG